MTVKKNYNQLESSTTHEPDERQNSAYRFKRMQSNDHLERSVQTLRLANDGR